MSERIWWSATSNPAEWGTEPAETGTRREQAAWSKFRRKVQKRFQSLRRNHGIEDDQVWLEIAVHGSRKIVDGIPTKEPTNA